MFLDAILMGIEEHLIIEQTGCNLREIYWADSEAGHERDEEDGILRSKKWSFSDIHQRVTTMHIVLQKSIEKPGLQGLPAFPVQLQMNPHPEYNVKDAWNSFDRIGGLQCTLEQ
jgi:hypothetical protein